MQILFILTPAVNNELRELKKGTLNFECLQTYEDALSIAVKLLDNEYVSSYYFFGVFFPNETNSLSQFGCN